jgi:hypothetical protein
MSEMVERVAKALLNAEVGGGEEVWRLIPEYTREFNRIHARAAISAMREPTSAMFDNAMPHMDSWSSNTEWWHKMIDGALK